MSEEARKAAIMAAVQKYKDDNLENPKSALPTDVHLPLIEGINLGWAAANRKVKLEIAEEIENHSYLALAGMHELCAWLDSLTKRLREETTTTASA